MKIRIELSLFGGMSIASMAFKDAVIEVEKYYSSEIDKYANKATDAMFPEINQIGDITKWRDWDIDWSRVDFITGGFPCQSWSMAGKQLGDKDERGMLFWTMLDIIKHVQHYNPSVNFMIENVRMKKEFEEYITTHTENALGTVHKTLINSALVSAQNRNRYYWTSFPVTQPEDEGILLRDILENNADIKFDLSDKCVRRIKKYNNGDKSLSKASKSMCIVAGYHKMGRDNTYIERPCELRHKKIAVEFKKWAEINYPGEDRFNFDIQGEYRYYVEHILNEGINTKGICRHVATATDIKGNESIKRVYADDGKSPTLTTMEGGHRQPKVLVSEVKYRKLTPRECFRLQTVPEHHIETLLNAGISNTQLYKMCGNAFTMKVISHILCCYKKANN